VGAVTPPLAVVGAGSLGQSFAAALAASGQAVTLLATPRSAEALRAAGAIRLHGALELTVPLGGALRLVAEAGALPPGAGVVFTPKGHQLAAAVAQVVAGAPDPAWVAGIQNGVVKDDLLAAAFGAERTLGAVTILGAARESDGRVAVASRGATYFGELTDSSSERATAAAAAFAAAGVPTEAVANIRTVTWSKMCNAAGLFAVTCLGRISSDRFGHFPELVRAYMGLIRETASVAAVQGIPMGDFPGFPIRTYLGRSDDANVAWFAERAASSKPVPGAPASRTSMYQDLLAGRPMEVEAIYGDVVARGERLGVAVPRLTLARDLLRAIDPGRAS